MARGAATEALPTSADLPSCAAMLLAPADERAPTCESSHCSLLLQRWDVIRWSAIAIVSDWEPVAPCRGEQEPSMRRCMGIWEHLVSLHDPAACQLPPVACRRSVGPDAAASHPACSLGWGRGWSRGRRAGALICMPQGGLQGFELASRAPAANPSAGRRRGAAAR